MRRLLSCLALAASVSLLAQDAPAPRAAADSAQPRSAFFVPDYLLKISVHARKLYVEIEVTEKNLQDKLQAKAAEMQQAQQQLQSPGLAPEGREALQKQMRDLEFEGKKLQEDSQAEYNKVRTRVMTQLRTEVTPIVETVAKERKLQVVYQYTEGLVAYADDEWLINFTTEVAKRFDAKYEPGSVTGAVKPAGAVKPTAPAAHKPAAKPAGK
jgi:Skp family chaperone for outer membrane proteins